MRQKMVFVVLLAAATISSGCASIQDGTAAALSGIRLSSPALEGLGFQQQNQIVTIVNPFDAPADLVAFNDTFGEIRPGETLSLVKGYEPFWTAQVPLALIFRKNGEYLGSAGKVIETGSNAQSVVWNVGESDVIRHGERAPGLGRAPGMSFRRARLPRCIFQGTSWVQFVNDSPYFAEVSLDGNRPKPVAPGAPYAVRATGFQVGWSSYPRSVPVIVHFVAVGGGPVREYWLRPVTQGVSAEQYILSP